LPRRGGKNLGGGLSQWTTEVEGEKKIRYGRTHNLRRKKQQRKRRRRVLVYKKYDRDDQRFWEKLPEKKVTGGKNEICGKEIRSNSSSSHGGDGHGMTCNDDGRRL